MTDGYIRVKGARVNNLKNIDLDIPRNKFIVVTGLSGSGKSSLAFDTLYAEGQRRYVESLSAYARQFLGRMNKPECDYIKGLPPAIAIEQKVTSRNPRSTVGTSTEIYDYLRLLFARAGHTFSPVSGREVKRHTVADVTATVMGYSAGTRFTLSAPLMLRGGRTVRRQLEAYLQQGLSRLETEGEIMRIEDYLAQLEGEGEQLAVTERRGEEERRRVPWLFLVAHSVETAFFEGDGECRVCIYPSRTVHDFSTRFEADGMTFEQPDDNMFSFNSPLGACPECEGFGSVIGIDEHLVLPDTATGFPILEPYYKLTAEQKRLLWRGEKGGRKEDTVCIDAFFDMLKRDQYKIQNRVMLARYRGKTTCPVCGGSRLRPGAEYVKVGGMSITRLVQMPITELRRFFDELRLDEHDARVASRLLTEIRSRLNFLVDVGLGYLTLDRLSNSLSGGESQRINLATSLGSALVGSLYILDEPSIGLHSRDTDRLIRVLHQLRDLGNTVIVVEHDEDIIRAADYIIDIGPDAGRHGGHVVWAGTPAQAQAARKPSEDTGRHSHTLAYLSGEETVDVPPTRRAWNHFIEVRGARANTLSG